jgi:peptidoglycan/LPS O-acetylase OafA/YrhL
MNRKSEHLLFVDVLRGCACLWVILCHAHASWLDLAKPTESDSMALSAMLWFCGIGGAGVDLFVVISGFCLAWPLVRSGEEQLPQLDYLRFLRRRAMRIIPTYLAAIAFVLVLIYAFGQRISAYHGLGDVVPYVLFFQNLMPDYTARINGTLWSVAMEVQLYLLFPLMLIVFRWRGPLLLVAIAALLSILASAVDLRGWMNGRTVNPFAPTSSLHHLIQFAIGIFAAATFARPNRWAVPAMITLLPLACIVCVMVHTSRGPAWLRALDTTAWAVVGGAVLMIAGRLPHWLFTGFHPLGWLRWLGLISYSVYVVHFPITLITDRYASLFGSHPAIQLAGFFMLAFPIIIVCAIALFWLVERHSIPRVRMRTSSPDPSRAMSSPVLSTTP